nr:integrase core domain-containing protein [Paracidovorax citrulli]
MSLRPGPGRRDSAELRAVPARRGGLLRQHRRTHRARHDRQRLWLQKRLPRGLRGIWPSATFRTRPYTPKTNGKAERFVQTSLREWAYARPYESSAQRTAGLQPFIDGYNWWPATLRARPSASHHTHSGCEQPRETQHLACPVHHSQGLGLPGGSSGPSCVSL